MGSSAKTCVQPFFIHSLDIKNIIMFINIGSLIFVYCTEKCRDKNVSEIIELKPYVINLEISAMFVYFINCEIHPIENAMTKTGISTATL